MEEITEDGAGRRFDPRPYLVNLNGKGEYLEVKWRLLWLRTEHPDAVVETELIRLEDRDAVFRARVAIPNGGTATGWGSESAGDFRDFLEKAETKALGRALAALGFGTQFCKDHDFGVGDVVETRPAAPVVQVATMRIVDAPVDLATTRGRRMASGAPPVQNADEASRQPATERQTKFILALGRETGLDEQELATWSQELYGCEIAELNRRDASSLIEALQRRRNEVM